MFAIVYYCACTFEGVVQFAFTFSWFSEKVNHNYNPAPQILRSYAMVVNFNIISFVSFCIMPLLIDN